jgi:hypothetical protein
MTDWNLINKGILGLKWIMECHDITNANKTLVELYGEKFAPTWGSEGLFNTGVLMMSAYLFFVYPQQADFDKIDYNAIDISKFNIIHNEKPVKSNYDFCRRIRNSISHARFSINNETDTINFKDETTVGTNKIEFDINIVDFGTFVTDFSQIVYQQLEK